MQHVCLICGKIYGAATEPSEKPKSHGLCSAECVEKYKVRLREGKN